MTASPRTGNMCSGPARAAERQAPAAACHSVCGERQTPALGCQTPAEMETLSSALPRDQRTAAGLVAGTAPISDEASAVDCFAPEAALRQHERPNATSPLGSPRSDEGEHVSSGSWDSGTSDVPIRAEASGAGRSSGAALLTPRAGIFSRSSSLAPSGRSTPLPSPVRDSGEGHGRLGEGVDAAVFAHMLDTCGGMPSSPLGAALRPSDTPCRTRPSRFSSKLAAIDSPCTAGPLSSGALARDGAHAADSAAHTTETMPVLPHKRGVRDALPRISGETLLDALAGRWSSRISRVIVVDCRYGYEYEGGHIPGAINVATLPDIDERLFHAPSDSGPLVARHDSRTAVVLHCEFSSERAPRMALHVRATDRRVNAAHYPVLCYPQLYVLDGGYRAFHEAHPLACEPRSGYVPMRNVANAGDLVLARRLRASGLSPALCALAPSSGPRAVVVLSSDACEDVRDCADEIFASAHVPFL